MLLGLTWLNLHISCGSPLLSAGPPLKRFCPSGQAADLADVSTQLSCLVRCVTRGRDGQKEMRLLVAVVGPYLNAGDRFGGSGMIFGGEFLRI